MTKKHKDLQPWTDYFRMLQQHADKGYLLMKPADHEAYVTQPALHAMTPGDDPTAQAASGAIVDTARHIRDYAAWLNAAHPTPAPSAISLQPSYISAPFALHVVEPEPPNDPIYTILIQQVRRFWRTREKVEVITYDTKVKSEE